MGPEMIVATVAATSTVVTALVAAFVTWRRDRNAEPVARDQVEATAGQLALDIARELRARVTFLEAEREQREVAREAERARVDGLLETLHMWVVWYSDLVLRWPMHRQDDSAPAAPEGSRR